MSDERLTDDELRMCVRALEDIDEPTVWPLVVRDGHEARLVRAVAKLHVDLAALLACADLALDAGAGEREMAELRRLVDELKREHGG
jgi:hypothetical protein